MVLGIAAAERRAQLLVGPLPEARQVRGHLHRGAVLRGLQPDVAVGEDRVPRAVRALDARGLLGAAATPAILRGASRRPGRAPSEARVAPAQPSVRSVRRGGRPTQEKPFLRPWITMSPPGGAPAADAAHGDSGDQIVITTASPLTVATVVGNAVVQITDGAFAETLRGVVLDKPVVCTATVLIMKLTA